MNSKKIIFLFLVMALLFCFNGCSDFWDEVMEDSDTVYVTSSGSCYHKSSCSTIKNSKKKAISRSSAKSQGYSRCSVCKP